jgi:hypothetical protein
MARHDRGEMRVVSQAHFVALAAVAGMNRPDDAALLDAMATGLPEDHALRGAVGRFRAVQAVRFPEPADLREAGAQLRHAVELYLMPQPVDHGRVDIHG